MVVRLCLCLIALPLFGCGGSDANGAGGNGGALPPRILQTPIDERRTVGEREFVLYVPSGIDLNEPTPLVMSFHGSTPGSLSASILQQRLTAANDHAQENGYIIVYPQGRMFGDRQGWETDAESPDIAFVDEILAALDEELGLDERRIFSAGISNGAAFSYTLACTRGEVIAAIGPVAGALPMQCPLTRRVPAIVYHGTEDARVSFTNGQTSALAWSQRNGCSAETQETFQNGDSTCDAWTACQDDGDVELCTIDGGGHTWPGSPFAEIFEMFGEGKTTMDLDATDHMWRFFEQHPMP